MPVEVKSSPRFDRDVKKLKRKFPTVVSEVKNLIDYLKLGETLPGNKVPGVGYAVYKVRLRNPSTRSGTSGGFRIIYYLQTQSSVILLTIYTKTAQVDISPSEIREIIRDL